MLDQKKHGSVHQVTVSYKLGCPSLGNGEHNWLSPLLVLFFSLLLNSYPFLACTGANTEKVIGAERLFHSLHTE